MGRSGQIALNERELNDVLKLGAKWALKKGFASSADMDKAMKKYGISVPDCELVCAPFSSDEGQQYFSAMAAAANFAWANRQVITYKARGAWEKIFGHDRNFLRLVYDADESKTDF